VDKAPTLKTQRMKKTLWAALIFDVVFVILSILNFLGELIDIKYLYDPMNNKSDEIINNLYQTAYFNFGFSILFLLVNLFVIIIVLRKNKNLNEQTYIS
jgi:hypothetical protein